MTNAALAVAATLAVGIGLVHSWLGERRLIGPLLAPEHRHGVLARTFSRQVLRFAWHITTLAWWGLAAILAIMATGSGDAQWHAILKVVALVFLLSGVITLVTSRGRHLAWPIFFLIAALAALPLWQVTG